MRSTSENAAPTISSSVNARWNSSSWRSLLCCTKASSIPTRRSATTVIAVVVTIP